MALEKHPAAAGLEVRRSGCRGAARQGPHFLEGPDSGGYGQAPPQHPKFIGFWGDMLIVIGFSLVIYFWAMAPSCPRPR